MMERVDDMTTWTKPSNFEVVVESNIKDHLRAAISLIVTDGERLAHYLVRDNAMHFFWHPDGTDGTKEGKSIALPYKMDASMLLEFVWGWLKDAPRGSEPDIDGSVYADGFRVDTAGSRDGWHYETFKVTAVWTLFHK